MELFSVGLVAALVALNLIGGSVLVRWLVKQIHALEGTVKAQGNTITAQGEALRAADQTYRTLNDLIKTLDLDQWARRFESHRRMVEQESEAKLAAAKRDLERALEAAVSQGQQTVEVWQGFARGYMDLATGALLLVPRADRAWLIDQAAIPQALKQVYKDWAARQPDPMEAFLRALAEIAEEGRGQDPDAGGFDVKPPPLKNPKQLS